MSVGLVLLSAAAARAELLPLVNGSFESPVTTYVTPGATGWTTNGPVLDPTYGFNPFTGVFANTAPGSPDHYANAVGDQLALIGTETGNEFVQFIPGTTFQAATPYTLSVGVGVAYTLRPVATDKLRIALFYVDQASQRQLITSAEVANDVAAALSPNSLKYLTTSATLAADHPAIGQPVGVLLTTIGTREDAYGKFFDMDNVTVSVPEPASLGLFGLAMILASRRRR